VSVILAWSPIPGPPGQDPFAHRQKGIHLANTLEKVLEAAEQLSFGNGTGAKLAQVPSLPL
jgi:hypothetical protein